MSDEAQIPGTVAAPWMAALRVAAEDKDWDAVRKVRDEIAARSVPGRDAGDARNGGLGYDGSTDTALDLAGRICAHGDEIRPCSFCILECTAALIAFASERRSEAARPWGAFASAIAAADHELSKFTLGASDVDPRSAEVERSIKRISRDHKGLIKALAAGPCEHPRDRLTSVIVQFGGSEAVPLAWWCKACGALNLTGDKRAEHWQRADGGA